jgi:quinol monooxygenase YgiN
LEKPMTDVQLIPRAQVEPGSRLEDLLATYAHLKPAADEAETRLKAVTDAIKAELSAAAPGALKVDVAHEALAQPLRLSYVESWTSTASG